VPRADRTVEIRSVVAENYYQLEKCYGHCEQPVTLRFLNTGERPVITGYSCHQAYLSRIIVYSDSLDLHVSRDSIAGIVGGGQEVREEDIRIASRYSWDLGITDGDERKLMMAAYWTQNYRRTKNEDPNRNALFLCEKCSKTFSQQLGEKQILCSDCRQT
jgi:hypothetical protein